MKYCVTIVLTMIQNVHNFFSANKIDIINFTKVYSTCKLWNSLGNGEYSDFLINFIVTMGFQSQPICVVVINKIK